MKTATVTIPFVGDVLSAPEVLTVAAVTAHKSRAILAAQAAYGSTDPDVQRLAPMLYANAAAWEWWLAMRAMDADDERAFAAHVQSSLSCAVSGCDWKMVRQIQSALMEVDGIGSAGSGVRWFTTPIRDAIARAAKQADVGEAFGDWGRWFGRLFRDVARRV